MHTTISVLEGLWELEGTYRENDERILQARKKAHEFLLIHHLFRSDRTGKIINPKWTRLPFPQRWYYDTLRALDYFRDCNAGKDQRMAEAIEVLMSKEKDGQ
ncbi:MAG: hypothetical protein KFF73_06480 [Cyclobacteriaceae bacterium]|nr:hypothetical protein [Cyclobacteriaceae bacterium]